MKNLNPLKVSEGAIMLRVISDVKGVRYLLNGVARAVHVVGAILEQSHEMSLKYEEYSLTIDIELKWISFHGFFSLLFQYGLSENVSLVFLYSQNPFHNACI